MMTSPNGNIVCVTGPLCGEFTGHRWIPLTRSFDVFFDLRLNKRLSAHYDVTVMPNTSWPLSKPKKKNSLIEPTHWSLYVPDFQSRRVAIDYAQITTRPNKPTGENAQ